MCIYRTSLLHCTGTQTESAPYNLQYELRWDPNNAQYDISVNNWQVCIIQLSYLKGVITESLRYGLHHSAVMYAVFSSFQFRPLICIVAIHRRHHPDFENRPIMSHGLKIFRNHWDFQDRARIPTDTLEE